MDRGALIAYVRSHGDGVVSSLGPDGAPQAAYLALTATDEGELVFDARASSRKIANLRRDPRVAVVVGGADGTTLQCEGTADLPEGAERERCAAAYLDAFPQFAASLSDDKVVVVRVRLTWSRFGDYRPAPAITIRRIQADEWELARALRLEALQDEAAGIAFLETHAQASAHPDELYRDRAARAADGDEVLQLVAVDGDTWVGSVTVIVQRAGTVDYHGHPVEHDRAVVVGVYVRDGHRGTGLVDRLLEAAAEWSRERGQAQLALGVHRDNSRAQGAYRRAGFVPSGVTFTGPIGPEIEMVRTL